MYFSDGALNKSSPPPPPFLSVSLMFYNFSIKTHLLVFNTFQQLSTNIKRMNCFRKDIRLTVSQSGKCSDYSRSGYDRGHMAPSGKILCNRKLCGIRGLVKFFTLKFPCFPHQIKKCKIFPAFELNRFS